MWNLHSMLVFMCGYDKEFYIILEIFEQVNIRRNHKSTVP